MSFSDGVAVTHIGDIAGTCVFFTAHPDLKRYMVHLPDDKDYEICIYQARASDPDSTDPKDYLYTDTPSFEDIDDVMTYISQNL